MANYKKTCPVCDEVFEMDQYGLVPIVCDNCSEKLPTFRLEQIKNSIIEARRDCVKHERSAGATPIDPMQHEAEEADRYGRDTYEQGLMIGIHEEIGSK